MIYDVVDIVYNVLVYGIVLISALYIAVPYLFNHWKLFRNRFFFSGVINYPSPNDKFLSQPEKFGLCNAVNHSIVHEGVKGNINLWILRPTGSKSLNTLILYCHGASSNRGKDHRVGLYKELQDMGYTIITFDYRGYGDSKGLRSNEISVVEDTRSVLKWAIDKFPSFAIIVWGHSLGTGIAAKFMSEDCQLHPEIRGLILESGFTSAMDAAKNFPAARFWNYFRLTRGKIAKSLDGVFPTIDLIHSIPVPIQLIHAIDDYTIPAAHSEKLHQAARTNNKQNIDIFIASTGQHKFVFQNTEAMKEIEKFISSVSD